MAMPTEKPSFGTLDGVKVVYAAVELACPKACDLMADWGADVTWLENTGAGDTIRDTAYIKQAERRNQRSGVYPGWRWHPHGRGSDHPDHKNLGS